MDEPWSSLVVDSTNYLLHIFWLSPFFTFLFISRRYSDPLFTCHISLISEHIRVVQSIRQSIFFFFSPFIFYLFFLLYFQSWILNIVILRRPYLFYLLMPQIWVICFHRIPFKLKFITVVAKHAKLESIIGNAKHTYKLMRLRK